MKPHNAIARIPSFTLIARTASELLLRPLLPVSIIDQSHALQKAQNAGKDGNGLVIIFTHFSLRDAMEVNRSIIFKDPVLKNREAINPLAFHQYNKFLELVGKVYHAKLFPIVNTSTLNKKGFEHLPKGKGLQEFVEKSGNLLEKGGIVTLAINASRREQLDLEDKQKPVGYFIASLQAKNIKNYGFLVVGFAIKGAKSYAKKDAGGINIGKTYEIRIGQYYTLDELLNQPEINGKVSNVDAFVRKEMAKIVPKEYLPKTS